MGQRGRKKPKRLGEKLLAIRVKLDISQSQLVKLLEFDKGIARISEYERGIREPDLITLVKYSKLSRVPMDVLADDSRELKFPESWKRPNQVTELLERQRRGRIQHRIDILRRQLSRSL